MAKKIQDTSASTTRPNYSSTGTTGWAVTGTKLTHDWINDYQGMFDDLFTRTGITATGGSTGDRNLYDAIGSMLTPYLNVATANTLYVDVAGDTMTGRLTLSADPVTNMHAATKQYVDTVGAARVRQGTGTSQTSNVVNIGWSAGSQLRVQVDATDFGSTWPISITGNASFATNSTNAVNATNSTNSVRANTLNQNGSGVAMTFNWSGQSGQPTWLWGGTDGTNHYVYNPSNFSVNYATYAASSIGDFSCGTNNVNSYIYFRPGAGTHYLGFDGGNLVTNHHIYGPGVGGDTRLAYVGEVTAGDTNAYNNAYNNATAWAANPAGSYLASGSGYKRLPGNIMIQWMSCNFGAGGSEGTVTFSFPTAFASTALSVIIGNTMTNGTASGVNVEGARIGTVTASTFAIDMSKKYQGTYMQVWAIGLW